MLNYRYGHVVSINYMFAYTIGYFAHTHIFPIHKARNATTHKIIEPSKTFNRSQLKQAWN